MTMTDIRTTEYEREKGVALLMVLILVIGITVVSLGFVSRCDVELACGQNMLLRTEMDQLAHSALDHARGLILAPQDVPGEYWTGAVDQQIVGGSKDHYDVTVTRDPNDRCTYAITCDAYRLKAAERIGQSRLSAELRLDPCIAFWTGTDTIFQSNHVLHGDFFCAGNIRGFGTIDGDVFCGALAGTISGSHNAVGDLSLTWPAVNVADFTSRYGTVTLSSDSLSDGETFGPYDPVHVVHRNGDLIVNSNVTVDGMLLVDGMLTIRGNGNALTAAKNLPALYVTGDLIIEEIDGLRIDGLAVVDGSVRISAAATGVHVLGGLFAGGTLVETAGDSSGGHHDCLLSDTPTWRPTGGQFLGALEFDGVNDYLQTVDDASSLQLTGEYTLALWLKPAAGQKPWAGVICKTDPNGARNQWTLQFYTDTPRQLIICHDTAKWGTGITLVDWSDGGWHHVAVVRQADGIMTSYFDGNPRLTIDPNDSFTGEGPRSGVGHLNIGADRTASSDYLYKGLIDDVRVYNRALSGVEIAAPPNDMSLIGYWRFDESGSEMTMTAAPAKSAIIVWPSSGPWVQEHWSPAAGAFFRRIGRN